ncbi:MAG: hypothetical protein ACI8RZ_005424 [Myxococcota bacterium]|jgi:hypothetical protein
MKSKTRLVTFAKRTLLATLILIPVALFIGYSLGARAHYADNPLAQNWDGEGPYVFLGEDDALSIEYIKNDADGGRSTERTTHPLGSKAVASCRYPLDETSFEFTLRTRFDSPASVYDDGNTILAISDIESNYGALRDFLINSEVIDDDLNWTFGTGHLVLVGDIVDRGYFTTQLLWLIYMLEQRAEDQGGHVHYIIGNHELKMMHGDYGVTDEKYAEVASILGKQQQDLYSSRSLLGRWMASKNAVERINGILFVHGGMHPDLADHDLDIDDINRIIRQTYSERVSSDQSGRENGILISRETGPCWYRGYFKDSLSQQQVDRVLEKFAADAVVVGHTIQSRVSRLFNGKVIGIDVQHPNDDHKLWPEGHSEALLIEGGRYYRILEDGEREAI